MQRAKDKALKRVIKLLALANSTQHEGERVSCLAMARNLIEKYQISDDQLNQNTIVSYTYMTEDLLTPKYPFIFKDSTPLWVRIILIQTAVICEMNPDVSRMNLNRISGRTSQTFINNYNTWTEKLIQYIVKLSTSAFEQELFAHKLGMNIIPENILRIDINSFALGLSQSLLVTLNQVLRTLQEEKGEPLTEDEIEVVISGLLEYTPLPVTENTPAVVEGPEQSQPEEQVQPEVQPEPEEAPQMGVPEEPINPWMPDPEEGINPFWLQTGISHGQKVQL